MIRKIQNSIDKMNYWLTETGCGGLDMVYVSEGKRDWMIWPRVGFRGVWDTAAPSIIMSEAGCKVTNLSGNVWSIKDGVEMLSANPKVHKEIINLMK